MANELTRAQRNCFFVRLLIGYEKTLMIKKIAHFAMRVEKRLHFTSQFRVVLTRLLDETQPFSARDLECVLEHRFNLSPPFGRQAAWPPPISLYNHAFAVCQ